MLQKDTIIMQAIFALLESEAARGYILPENDKHFIGDMKTRGEEWHAPVSRFSSVRDLSNQEAIKLKNLHNKIEREIA